jgi:type VI secretion system protein ImpJ
MAMRPAFSVCWQDGMFMWPQHMQQQERYQTDRLRLGHRWNTHHNWGLRTIEWDADALQSGRLGITRLQARLRDGTLIDVPADGRLPTLDLNEILVGREQVTIYLAIALVNNQSANVTVVPPPDPEGAEPAPITTRYVMEKFEVADENDGADQQTLEFRTYHLKLLVHEKDLPGYEVLEIARFNAPTTAGSGPVLDPHYIPPVLACDAWKPLADGILQWLFHHLGSRMDGLATKAVTRGITFETQNPGDNRLLGRLAVLNEASTVLNTIAFAQGVHPFTAYLELCRIVGKLAIFTADRRAPKLPAYDHDDLGACFQHVKRYLEQDEDTVAYEERPFIGEELRMQVSIEAKWLEPAWQVFVGVRSPLPQAEVIDLLTTPGQLDMKIGSSDRVDRMFTHGIPSLEFTHSPHPPRVLPTMPDLTYFQVNRDSRQNEWDKVQQSLKFAVRLNHKLFAVGPQGAISGERVITLNQRGLRPATTMQFSLFVVAEGAS